MLPLSPPIPSDLGAKWLGTAARVELAIMGMMSNLSPAPGQDGGSFFPAIAKRLVLRVDLVNGGADSSKGVLVGLVVFLIAVIQERVFIAAHHGQQRFRLAIASNNVDSVRQVFFVKP